MNAKSEIRLTETSSVGISQMPPRNEIGIPRLTHSARRSLRKSESTMMTSMKPIAPLRINSERRSCSTFDMSCQWARCRPSGRLCFDSAM